MWRSARKYSGHSGIVRSLFRCLSCSYMSIIWKTNSITPTSKSKVPIPSYLPQLINEKAHRHIPSQFTPGFAMFHNFSVNVFAKSLFQLVEENGSLSIEHNCGMCRSQTLQPTNLNAKQCANTTKAMGATEICITGHHEGGFALWSSNFSSFYVYSSHCLYCWHQGVNVPWEFGSATCAAGIKVCYYISPIANRRLL